MKQKNYPYHNIVRYESLRELLNLAEERFANMDAYIFKQGKTLHKKTFTEFANDVHALASHFIDSGYAHKRIAILAENSYEWIVTWFATVISGNIAVPLDKMLGQEQLDFVLQDTTSSVLVYSRQFREHAEFFAQKDADLRIIQTETDLWDCVSEGAASLAKQSKKRIVHKIGKHEPVVIIYTSGTTGVAKGVTLTNDNFCSETMAIAETLESYGSNLLVLPLNHAYALVGCVLVVMTLGRTTYICSGLKRFSQEIKEFAPTEMYLVPLFVETMYNKIMDAAKQKGKEKQLHFLMKLSMGLYNMGIDIRRKLFATVLKEFGGNLRLILCGGAPIDPMYIKAFRAMGITVLEGYGITECSPTISVNRNHYSKDGSVGIPYRCVQVKTDAPDGKSTGELLVKGPIVMPGYYQNDAATQEAFDGEWFKTGDIGHIDADGFIFITGRKKNIIILSNGKNLYPEELEQQLQRIPAVAEVLVYEDNRTVAAEIYPNTDYLEANNIKDAYSHLHTAVEELNKTLPAGKSIAKLTLREEPFPKTSTQKIIRKR